MSFPRCSNNLNESSVHRNNNGVVNNKRIFFLKARLKGLKLSAHIRLNHQRMLIESGYWLLGGTEEGREGGGRQGGRGRQGGEAGREGEAGGGGRGGGRC